jgi:hypothetical protein
MTPETSTVPNEIDSDTLEAAESNDEDSALHEFVACQVDIETADTS